MLLQNLNFILYVEFPFYKQHVSIAICKLTRKEIDFERGMGTILFYFLFCFCYTNISLTLQVPCEEN